MRKKAYLLLMLAWLLPGFILAQSTLYVAPNGSASNPGTISSPTTLENAIVNLSSGGTIFMRGGTYNYSATIVIQRGNDGSSGSLKKIFAYNNEVPVLNFSAMAENSSNRGIVLDAFYWHLRGLIIQQAGDNGMLLSGNNNIIESCIFRGNHDSGLQLSRFNSSFTSISQWPSNNLILNCESYDNHDSDNEDADGFAAKLTCGTGNIFRGCVSHNNIDDGWDLYTKPDTGPIGAITLENCISHDNGILTTGGTSGNGDKNGFKLGGEDISVNHIVRRCIAFNNGKHGFTYNRNLGTIEMTNNTSYNNTERNFNFDGGTSVFKNNLSFQSGSNDRIIGNASAPNSFVGAAGGFTVTSADFVTLTPGPGASPTSTGFLNLASGSDLVNAGVATSGITFNGSAPDLGAIESGGTTPPPPSTFTLSVSADPSNGGTITRNPDKTSYTSGEVVTLTASPNANFSFVNWSGDASGSSASISVTMDGNKNITANFNSTSTPPPPGPSVRIEDSATPATGLCSYDGSLASYSGADNGTAINLSNSSQKGITWKVSAGSSGTYQLTWRYVNGGSSAATSAALRINGATVNSTVPFPKTSDKSTFITTSVNATLVSGINEIRLETTVSSEFADIDWIEISGSNVAATNCDGTTPPPPTTFSLSVASNPSAGGTVSLNPSGGTYTSGTLVTITATPAGNYTFANWSGDAAETSTSTTVTMNSNKSVTANFSQVSSTVTLRLEDAATPSSGFCSVDGVRESEHSGADNGFYLNSNNASGAGISWNVNVPSSGTYTLRWRFANGGGSDRPGRVLINGSTALSSVSFPATSAWTSWTTTSNVNVSLPSGVSTIRLEGTTSNGLANIDWMEITGNNPTAASCSGTPPPATFTLSVASNPSAGGTVSLNPSGGTYTSGTVVTITATPASNYTFANWSGDASGTSSSTTVTMNANKSVTANFNPVVSATTLRLEDAASPSSGFCSVEGARESEHSGADNGFYLNSNNASGAGINWNVNVPSSGTYTLRWRFANAGGSDRPGRVLVNGSTAVSSVSFPATSAWTSWATTSNVNVSLPSGVSTIRLEGTTSNGLANVDWMEITGDNPTAASCSGGQSTTFTLSVSSNPSAGGTVSLSPSGGTYASGTVVTVTATPSSGYTFSNWSGAASGSTPSTTITMDGNKSVTANFSVSQGGGNVNFDLVGYATQAGGTTGGAGGTSVTVNTGTALQDAIKNKGSQPLTIFVNGTITLSNSTGLSKIDIKDVDDISILGVGTSGEFNGIGIKITRASNIIIRNLRIHHVSSGDKDCISIEGPADHIWVDHCELYNEFQGVDQDFYDGLLDVKAEAEYITYSWNYLHDSWKTGLVGSSESDDFDRKLTMHHNFYENCNSRMPLFRGGNGHIFNNYYKDGASTAINSRIGACVRIENNYFLNTLNPWVSAYSDVVGYGDISGNITVNSPFVYSSDTHELGSCNASIPYSYSNVLNSADQVPAIVMANAGVGKISVGSSGARIASSAAAEERFDLNVSISPNPTTGTVTVDFTLPEDGVVKLDVVDMTGRPVTSLPEKKFKAGKHQLGVDLRSSAIGLYVCNIQYAGTVLRKKIILEK